ncbi:MAG: mannose-1-phosphate guanylyltransferase [Syntrophus sp. (in: bacteria)]|nr:mannose-1-phosphate guanylyltransferase [Syntrophus sp. (in: bacteria)]
MYAVIMAGGRGARFWPRSRESKPKHLLDIVSDKTIVRETVDRISPLIRPENILIVTGESHAQELMRQLPDIPQENIIIEPVGRNTAPCIGLAALHIKRKAPDAVMLVLPSDHLIADEDQFRKILSAAAAVAQRGDDLVTVGIRPTGPETGYGYIEQGREQDTIEGEKVYDVRSIREKPDLTQARSMLARGGFSWNSGMFIWKVSVILKALEQWLPDLYAGLLQIEAALGSARETAVVAQVYQQTRSVSIDYGVMEKARNTLVIPGNFGWSDVGSWDALWEVSPHDEHGNAVRGEAITIDSRNCLVHSPGKTVALVGVEDLIIVETADALLICKRGASQGVRKVVDRLERENRSELL